MYPDWWQDQRDQQGYIPYSGKFPRDKSFTDGSKNENWQIKFSQMLARVTRQNSENA